VVDAVTLEQVSRRVPQFSAANRHSTIAPYSSIIAHEVYDSPDQAVHYNTVGHKLGFSSLTGHLAGLGVKVV
jgi:hypothetical protein